jgi:hypothetical protein
MSKSDEERELLSALKSPSDRIAAERAKKLERCTRHFEGQQKLL